MRPDARLYSLAGLSAQSGTVADGYVALNPASEPAPGITTETMQFHGTANRYALSGRDLGRRALHHRHRGTPACPPSPCAAWAPTAARSPPSPSTSRGR